jgi:hypothetical protein
MGQFKINSVSGNIGVLSVYDTQYLPQGSVESDILTVSRRYTDAATGLEKNAFHIGDLVKVEISWKAGARMVEGM